jgi:mono/diheme cytochrome c family protein
MTVRIFAAQVLAVACAVWTASPVAAEPPPARQAELRDLVKNECTRCHGYQRTGQQGPSLLPKDVALKPADYLIRTILNGRNTQMPAWKGMLSVEDVEFIVRRVLSEPPP